MIVLALVLAFIAYVLPTSQPPTFVAHESYICSSVNFYWRRLLSVSAVQHTRASLCCAASSEKSSKAATAPRIPHGELSVADEQLWRVTKIIRARRVSGNGIVGEVHRSQSTNRLG